MALRAAFRRIGLLLPSSNTTQEPEFARILPSHITVHLARLTLRRVEADATVRIAEEIEQESRKLADADVDAVMLAATAPSSRFGIGYDQELIARITASCGKPATTAATATVQALAELGVHRVALAAPWSEAVNAIAAGFMQDSGYNVVARRALGLVDNLEIGLLDPQIGFDLGRAVDCPEAEAVLLACGNWRTLEVVDALEAAIGKPVLTTNQVSLWAALRLVGHAQPLDGWGRLLRHQLAPAAAGAA